MKPLHKCPYCGCNLKEHKANDNWYETYCPDHCTMEYHQYFDGDFASERLRYISFSTEHFNVYVYFENGFHPNIVHFYSHLEMRARGTAMPILDNLPANRIPVHELEEMDKSRYETNRQAREWLARVDEKLHTLALFS